VQELFLWFQKQMVGTLLFLRFKMVEQYWQTKNGLVAVGDMTPDHLRNVLRQLIREKRILPPYKLKSAMLAEIEAEREDIHDCIDIDGCQEY
jgi:hypothetical protein